MLFAISLALLLAGPPLAEDGDLQRELKRFVDVLAGVERNAADQVDTGKAIYGGAIPGMLRRLDPHSVFFDPDQFQQLQEMEKSTRKGFGSIVSVLPGRVIVLQTLPGTPSAKSGMSAGDEIVAINNIPLAALEFEQLVGLLQQSRQQPARIDVRRPGAATIMTFMLTPEELQAPSVDRAFILRPGIGYVRITSFDAETGSQVRQAIDRLGGGNLGGLILDLRNNPGGFLGAAIETASLFLEPKTPLLAVRGRSVQSKQELTPDDAKPYHFPLAVLIDGRSASASEIVAGALQDHDRATIVGEASFGKGLVESVFPLSEGTGLALTTAYYYTPSGRSIQKPLRGAQIDVASRAEQQADFRTDSGRRVRGGGGIQPDIQAFPEAMTRFRAVVEASAAFTSFAIEFVRSRPNLEENFEVTPDVLDRFQAYLSERRIRPSIEEWTREREWIRNRLKAEIFNQAFGVARGDEVEAQRDPVIRAAVDQIEAKRAAAATGKE